MRDTERRNPFLGLLVFLIPLLLFASTLDDWWLVDDPQVVLQALRSTVPETLFSPEVYRALSSANFTPWVVLSFELDLDLFGLSPVGFHVHQLLSFALGIYLFYVLGTRFTRPALSAIAALGLAGSAAGGHLAASLMLRHYVEGFVLALFAILLWESESNDDQWWSGHPVGWSATLAGACYLGAMLAKEVYATIPVLFIAISIVRREPSRRIIPRMLPAGGAAILYLFWRWRILGSFGGYSSEVTAPSLEGIWSLASGVTGGWIFTSTLVGLGLMLGLLLASRFRSSIVVGALLAIVLILPLIPVLGTPELRYLFVPLSVALMLGAVAADTFHSRTVGVVILLAWVSFFVAGGVRYRATEVGWQTRMRAEGEYVWSETASSPILWAGSPEWYLAGLAEIRTMMERGSGPSYLLSEAGLVLADFDLDRVVVADEQGRVTSLPRKAIDGLRRERSRSTRSLLSEVEVRNEGGELSWQFGPDCHCSWEILSFPGYDETGIPRLGSRRIPATDQPRMFRVRVETEDGRWFVSPVFYLPRDGEEVRWRR